ncbi:IS66-like element accessory protein TnpA [Collimonas humicola]|uniref:IS66-like element accessory protein TnpA n=1 Tax=Collimonas humicola TaxID=2825886 RepID=UPI001B8D211A|nr:transposase [Collimonas humicola]
MDTHTPTHTLVARPRSNRRHPAEFKRAVVEQSFLPGASVASLARSHGINANLIFAWRKLYCPSSQTSVESDIALLPVVLSDEIASPSNIESSAPHETTADEMEMVVGKARLIIKGKPDTDVLQTVLAYLLR